MNDVRTLIGRVGQGDGDAFNVLFEALYPDRKRIAHARLSLSGREGPDDTTGLVHECYSGLSASKPGYALTTRFKHMESAPFCFRIVLGLR